MTVPLPSFFDYLPFNLLESESLPNTIHGKHDIVGNSGFFSSETFIEALSQSNKLSQEQLSGLSVPKNKEENLPLFFQKERETNTLQDILKKIDPYCVFHGGGSLYSYALLAQKRNQSVITITLHESRMREILYEGEEYLAQHNIARGQFGQENFEILTLYARNIGDELGVKILFVLELENFGEGEKADFLRKKQKCFRDMFSNKILSTHFIPKNPEKISLSVDDVFSDHIGFIDGSRAQFIEIIEGHGYTVDDISSGNINAITVLFETYITVLIHHVEREGEKGDILGHCDLIKLHLHRLISENSEKKRADRILKNVVSQDCIQSLYTRLFIAVKKKEMLIEINLAGEAKGVGFYGNDLLDIISISGVKVCIGSDSHNICDEEKAEKIWRETVRISLLNAQILTVYEI